MPHQWLFRPVAEQVLVVLLIVVLGGSRWYRANATKNPADAAPHTFQHHAYSPFFGLNFGPYINVEAPGVGAPITERQLRDLLQRIAPYANWVRTFGSAHGLEQAGAVAKTLGLKMALGAWLSADIAANEQELANLIAAARKGQADIVIVGSEVLLWGKLSETDLIEYIRRVQQALPGIAVSTADVYSVLLSHPAVIAAVDIVLANFYPFWEGVALELAVVQLQRSYHRLKAAAGGKAVMISETGWPSCGQPIGAAVPSLHNANIYLMYVVSWAREHGVSFFYFAAFDEQWKAKYEGSRGACWGIWDTTGTMKPGMQRVFDDAPVKPGRTQR